MKTLLALLVLALVLAGGYWKVQNPDGGMDELQQQAGATVQRLQRGVDTVIDGKADPASQEPSAIDALESRLAALEAAVPTAAGDTDADTSESQADEADRIDEIEASLNKVRREMDTSVAGNETTIAELDALSATVTALQSRVSDLAANITDDSSDGTSAQAADGNGSGDGSDAMSAAVEARFSELDKRIATLARSVEAPAESADGSSVDSAAEEAPAADPPDASSSDTSTDAPSDSPADAPPTVDQEPTSDDDQPAANEMAEAVDDEMQAEQAGRSIEYKIYFELGSTDITDEAGQVLDSFIVQEQNRTIGVSIFGLTDRRGPAEFNRLVADERARNVQSYLVQNGLDGSLITAVSGLGEDAAATVLDDNESDAQQRAVVLFATQP